MKIEKLLFYNMIMKLKNLKINTKDMSDKKAEAKKENIESQDLS